MKAQVVRSWPTSITRVQTRDDSVCHPGPNAHATKRFETHRPPPASGGLATDGVLFGGLQSIGQLQGEAWVAGGQGGQYFRDLAIFHTAQ